jgi:hypothetical protein
MESRTVQSQRLRSTARVPARRLHTLGDGQRGAPLVTQNVEADAAVGVDVGVVDPGREVDLWGLEGVVGRELDLKEEDTASVGRVTLSIVSVDGSFGEPRGSVRGCHGRTAAGTYSGDSQDP